MTFKEFNENYGTAALVALTAIILIVTAGAIVATCAVERAYPEPGASLDGEDGADGERACPLATEAMRRCLGPSPDESAGEMTTRPACAGHLDTVGEIMRECSSGAMSDQQAAFAIDSIEASRPARAEPVRL